MTPILATGFTPGYSFAGPYVGSIEQHCNIRVVLFAVDHDYPGAVRVPNSGQPRAMLQHGGFAQHMPAAIEGDPVVLFDRPGKGEWDPAYSKNGRYIVFSGPE
jgi:hypothetical protein